MKKTIFTTNLIICLLCSGLAKAQTTDFITPASAYTLSSQAGTFTDIADNPNTVKLGGDLTANTALKNGFFVNDATTPFVTYASQAKTDPGFELGFDLNFCGKTMKYFTVCASGGLHFGATANIPQTQSGVWNNFMQDFQNLVTVVTWDTANVQNTAQSIAGQAPAMYLIEGEAGQKVLTVQYHYTVNNDEWTYQIKVHEASGNIEFVAGNLNTRNVAQKKYRLFFALVENTNSRMANDPFKTMNLHFSDLASHKVGFENKAETDDWSTSTVYTPCTTDALGDGLDITPDNKPQSGYTLTFNAPADCAEKAKKFEDEWYSFGTTNITKTSFTGQITLNKDAITPEEIRSVGTLVAILSTSETPAYTLSNGSWYQVGDKPDANSQVLFNAKPTYQIYGDHISTVTAMKFSANNLEGSTTYYLHIYAMDYRCTGAPVYSDLCRTFPVTTSIDLPQTLSAGLPTTSSVPLTVMPAEGLGMVLLKSPNTNALKLSGKLNAGDKIGDAEVLTVITTAGQSVYNAPFEAGEGAYILAYSVNHPEAESPTYAHDFLNLPVRAAYDTLPMFRFEGETYASPNANEYGRLPFGWSRETEFPEAQRSNAFRLERIDFEYTCLTSSYPSEATFWADVVTPAFALPTGKTKISATFYTSYEENTTLQGTKTHKPTATDVIRIEYSVNGGDWQTVLSMDGTDDDFPKLNAQKQYPLTAMITGLMPNSIIRLRYSYRSPASSTTIHNRIHAVDVIEGRDCDQPKSFQLIDSLITNNQMTFSWLDNNLPAAPNFVLAYQAEGADKWQYTRVSAGSNQDSDTPIKGRLSDLNAGVVYHVKVAALCSTRDTSFYTEPLMVRTAYDLPYEESMAKTGSGASAQTPFDRGVTTYSGTIGGRLTETTDAKTDWSQSITSDAYNMAMAISIGDFTTDAWLMMPIVYIRENGDFTPKSLNFTLSSFDSDKNKGTQPNYNDTKLNVLISNNGLYTTANIVKTLEYKDLALNEQAFTIDLTEWEGFLQVAFVFECPTGAQTPTTEDEAEERPDTWYLEITQLSIKYDIDVCFPVENLNRSLGVHDVPLTWDASASAVEYGIFWGIYSEEGYRDSAFTTEAHYTITGLQDQTRYRAMVIAYCNEDHSLAALPTTTSFRTLTGCHTPENFHTSDILATGADFVSTSDQPDYMTQRIVYITPDNGGKTFALIQEADTLHVRDSLTKLTAYTATTQAVCEADTSAMSEEIHFTTLDKPNDSNAIETVAQLNGLFSVRTQDGQIAIRNLNNLLVRNVAVFNLSATKLADFRVDSRDDLLLPINVRRMLIFVRLQTERGVAVYKIYLP